MKKFAPLVVAALVALPVIANAGPQKAGKWEVTVASEMVGMQMKMPVQTVTTCVTKEQAEKPEPPKNRKDSDCKISDYKIEGNTVSWKLTCQKSDTTAEGKMTFHGDTYEGVNHFKVQGQEVITKMNGKYIGACDSK